jgi:DNA polymerase elongation subunit (family B)
MPVLTGWNFLNYDWLYLVNRARKLTKTANGREYKINPNVSSITRKLVKVMNTDFERPAHRMIFDYMMLYEIVDTSIKVKESSSLDFVSKSLIGIDKIKYTNSIYVPNGNIEIGGHHINSETIIRKVNNSEYYYYRGLDEILINEYDFLKNKHLFKEINIASLQSLYENDFETYMYYNAVDSVLVQKIHESKNYISILFAIASLAKIKVVDVISYMNGNLGTIAITEGVLRNRFRDENLILVKNNQQNTNIDTKKIKGGYVKDPIVGMNKWVVCYDFASLYPRTQMEFYISPENFVGIRDINNKSICTNGTPIDMDNHVVCINDVVFKKTKSPTLKMLEEIYADRVVNKKIMMRKKEEWSSIMDEINELKMDLQLI